MQLRRTPRSGYFPQTARTLVFCKFISSIIFFGSSNYWDGMIMVCTAPVLRQTGASPYAWIDRSFCASAILQPNRRMVLNIERIVPTKAISPSSILTLFGPVDYTVVAADQDTAGNSASIYLICPPHCLLSNPTDRIPQAVRQMYACGKLLQ